MSRNLIDRDVLIATLNREKIKYNADVNYFIMDAPTIDAVEVVRCRDCKFKQKCPTKIFGEHSDDWFCAGGERRDPCS